MGDVSPRNCVDLSERSASPRPFNTREQLVEELRQKLGRWGVVAADEEECLFSCGAPAIDRLLPGNGLRHGMLLEWVSGDERAGEQKIRRAKRRSDCGSGALPLGCSSTATLGLLAAREACREGGVLVVVDRAQVFYPPAAAAWEIDLERLVVVRPENARDELWSAVQALRSPVVAALWARIERLDSRAFRRLQLAAEAGRTLGVLMRPVIAREEPTWADVRLEVEACQDERSEMKEKRWRRISHPSPFTFPSFVRRVYVRLTHCHAGRAGGSAMLEIGDVNRTVREINEGYRLSAIGSRPNRVAESPLFLADSR